MTRLNSAGTFNRPLSSTRVGWLPRNICSALPWAPELRNSYENDEKGGKSGEGLGRFRVVLGFFGAVSHCFHWRLFPSHRCPRSLPSGPLSTTFVHILRLTVLLSTLNLRVLPLTFVSFGKSR